MNIKELKNSLEEALADVYSSPEREQVVFLVMEWLTGFSRPQQVIYGENEVSKAITAKAFGIAEKLKKSEPLQYVLGETEFYGLSFSINPGALIPRRETEELVEWVIDTLKRLPAKRKLLDIGTGSGCIAIALKKNLSQLRVSAWDISENALEVARKNADKNHVSITFDKKDILNNHVQKNFDVIVSNPPYVPVSDKNKMAPNVLDYEPEEALFVPDDNALRFYYAIADFSLNNLSPGGYLFLEIHELKSITIREYLERVGFQKVEIREDMQGKPRMIKAEKKE
ncbi:MAG: peptide chain release factor N(5)-glutamine methyltransferase [Bacteroidales bacterium]|nr:peptide chain release factor N(5)-glutamine methyltransferase [Bacteroidales bacterium]MCF8333361.1 peptide chain release factor N(5)-glutamine methyltransferase [Bacteroidales bacterium]